MSDTNEHSRPLSYQIRRAIKAEDELRVAQAQVKLLTDQWNALPIKELVVNADYREMWRRQLKMNQQLIAALSAEKQAQPEPHLFEFWWAEYMPEATQEQAFKAWSAAPSSKGVGVVQQVAPDWSRDSAAADSIHGKELTKQANSALAAASTRSYEVARQVIASRASAKQAQPERTGLPDEWPEAFQNWYRDLPSFKPEQLWAVWSKQSAH